MRHNWKHLAYVKDPKQTKQIVDRLFAELRATSGVADYGCSFKGSDDHYIIGMTADPALQGRWDEDVGEILVVPGYESIVRDIWARLGLHYSNP